MSNLKDLRKGDLPQATEAALLVGTGFDVVPGSDDVSPEFNDPSYICLLYTSPSPRDRQKSRMPSSA